MKYGLTLAALAAVLMVAAPASADILSQTTSQTRVAGQATVDALKVMSGAGVRTQAQATQLVGNAQTVASVWGLLQQVRSQGLLPVTEADWTEYRNRVNSREEAVALLQKSLASRKALTTSNFATLYASVTATATTTYAANVASRSPLEEVETANGQTPEAQAFVENLKSGSRLYAPVAETVGDLLVENRQTARVVCSTSTVAQCENVGAQALLEAGARGRLENQHGVTLVRNAFDAFGTRNGDGLKYRMGLLISAKMPLAGTLQACWTGSVGAN